MESRRSAYKELYHNSKKGETLCTQNTRIFLKKTLNESKRRNEKHLFDANRPFAPIRHTVYGACPGMYAGTSFFKIRPGGKNLSAVISYYYIIIYKHQKGLKTFGKSAVIQIFRITQNAADKELARFLRRYL